MLEAIMRFLYNVFLIVYVNAIRIYAFFNEKARKWVSGRKEQEENIQKLAAAKEDRIWIHCSSLGEFEQGRSFIETIKKKFPACKIVLTFFSPSGYEACKSYVNADYIYYLPMDGRHNAEQFLEAVKPSLAVFVKYEFWYYYLTTLKSRNIPTILVSGAFRPDQAFFKAYGAFFRRMLECFNLLFVQDERSKQLLAKVGFVDNVIVAGDTRYDRVAAISSGIRSIKAVEDFKGTSKILIAGSTWPGDEDVLRSYIDSLPQNWKLIIAPHEIDKPHVQKIKEMFSAGSILFSELSDQNKPQDKRVLIIDNIGMLSSLYAYGDIAFVGGGFQKGGIHNILEPAVFGLPVVFGPVYEKFVEANTLVDLKYAFPVNNAGEFKDIVDKLISDEHYRLTIGEGLKTFMKHNIGATETIIEHIRKEKWLNN